MTVPVAVVAAEFNKSLIDTMVRCASDEVSSSGGEVVETASVPGCYELPLVVDVMLSRADIAGVVVLGYIERGETRHGEVMANVVAGALVGLELKHGKPVGMGIIGPGATGEQAEVRKEAYASAAARALMATIRVVGRSRRG